MITHDLGIVAHFCDTVAVMHEGNVVETGTSREILKTPQFAYTQRLVESSQSRALKGANSMVES
jgi:ABC-type dipeptide/oligopeptide/nickel transport system ATPase component